MSDLPARSSAQKRRSFTILLVVLVAAALAVTFVLSAGGDTAPPSPSAGTSASPGQVTLATACAEIAPDMALRVDALQRTAEAVRADIATMESQGNTSDAEQAALVAVALERMAEAQRTQRGVGSATRALGRTLSSIC